MADTKTTDLASLLASGANDADVLPVVDVSDTSMAASGTTKKMTFAELSKMVGAGGRLILDVPGSTPAAPAAGVTMFARRAARTLPAFVGPSGLDSSLQPHFGANRVAFMTPNGNATTVTAVGMVQTAQGTATAANWANTNMFTAGRRISYISAATAGAFGGWREAVLKYAMGTSGWGGFHFMCRFGYLTLPAGYRLFHGLQGGTGAFTNVDPSTQLNMVGLGRDSADTNLQFMHNDGAGVATKIDTGIALATSGVYDFRMFAASGVQKVFFSLQRLDGGGSLVNADSGVSADLPAATQGLAIHHWCTNNATASAIDPHFFGFYIETDN